MLWLEYKRCLRLADANGDTLGYETIKSGLWFSVYEAPKQEELHTILGLSLLPTGQMLFQKDRPGNEVPSEVKEKEA